MAISRQQMIEGLNEDLAYELSSIIQYITYAAKVTGPFRPELSRFFEREIPEETGHAKFLADKIVSLGGEPVSEPAAVERARTNREMLEAVLRAEAGAVERYSHRVDEADEFGDVGLRSQLETMVQQETHHRDEVERILRGWGEGGGGMEGRRNGRSAWREEEEGAEERAEPRRAMGKEVRARARR